MAMGVFPLGIEYQLGLLVVRINVDDVFLISCNTLNYFLVYIWKNLVSEKCYHMRLQTRRVSLWHERKDPAGGVWLRGNTALPLEATRRSLVLQGIGISLLSYFSAIYAFMAAKYLNSSWAYHVEFYQRQTISSFQHCSMIFPAWASIPS